MTDMTTWCCNLEVFGCICDQYGTYAQISFYCNHTKNRGINCSNCLTSPQCKPVQNLATAAAALPNAFPPGLK